MAILYKCDYCGKTVEENDTEDLNNWIFITGESDEPTKYYGRDAIIPDRQYDQSSLQFLTHKTFCSLKCFKNFLIKHLEGESK